ncbi:G-protein coupled receptor 183-like [Colossoma macropomum]|uniref:G-protein coupled receptor 183-like n=1 Tax=Colossoma macropomum TaxID=42526 RepID=UPI001863CFAE|nr:G-protein coupled receptor 183-like [Colossoma macropomum]
MGQNTLSDNNQTITISGLQDSFQTNFSWSFHNWSSLADVISECNKNGTPPARLPIQILILVLALPVNIALVWLLLKNKRALSPSEVLGLNLAVLSILYCLSLPLDIYISTRQRSGLLLRISHTFTILSYFGCPLLLTSMCVERYVAVSHPVVFMKLGKWEYRAACSAFIWLLTFIMAGATYIYTLSIVAIPLSLIMNILFLLMLACLLGIVWVLCKKGPGASTPGEQRDSSIKKRALKNILAVIVPSTLTYLPILAMAPFLLLLQAIGDTGLNMLLCNGLQMFSVIPNFGVCIGPVFYVSRARQVLCCYKNETRNSRETKTENETN